MQEKRVHRVSVFFGDSEFDQLAIDADAAHREPSDYLRSLWLQDRRRRDEERAAKVRAWALECEKKQRALDARAVQPVAHVAAFRASHVPTSVLSPWANRDDDGFEATRPGVRQG